VVALDFSTSASPTAPITILGAQTVSPAPTTLDKLQIVRASVEGYGPWTSWFAGGGARILVLTVYNPDSVPYVMPSLVLSAGTPADLRAHETTGRRLASIGAGRTTTYRVPLSFPAFSVGEQHVVGVIGNAGLTRTFAVQTRLFPWGLLVPALILLELVLLTITRFFRERWRRREALDETTSGRTRGKAACGEKSSEGTIGMPGHAAPVNRVLTRANSPRAS
jgi:hypothetical protein